LSPLREYTTASFSGGTVADAGFDFNWLSGEAAGDEVDFPGYKLLLALLFHCAHYQGISFHILVYDIKPFAIGDTKAEALPYGLEGQALVSA